MEAVGAKINRIAGVTPLASTDYAKDEKGYFNAGPTWNES
jgi:hypothetical protein